MGKLVLWLVGSEKLRPYEQLLLDVVVPVQSQGARVSQLSEVLTPALARVQECLYHEVVERGWFERRPDDTRNFWGRMGWLAAGLSIGALVVLVALTTFGLLGLSLVALALGLVWISERMPRRTAAGTALLAGLSVFSGVLLTQPTNQLPPGKEVEELSKILPYAVVLGGRDRWLQAIVDADPDPTTGSDSLSWYHADGNWRLADLPAAIRAFVTTVQGELLSR